MWLCTCFNRKGCAQNQRLVMLGLVMRYSVEVIVMKDRINGSISNVITWHEGNERKLWQIQYSSLFFGGGGGGGGRGYSYLKCEVFNLHEIECMKRLICFNFSFFPFVVLNTVCYWRKLRLWRKVSFCFIEGEGG